MTGPPPAAVRTQIRVAVADDHPVVRDGLVAMLETQSDFTVVGQAASGTEALALVGAIRPDVLLLDLEMPGLDGVGVLRGLTGAGERTRVIVFTVLIMVRERSTEIGTLKAIGASHWQVIRQFWGEVLALSGLAAIIAARLLAALGPTISSMFKVSSITTSNMGGFGGPGGGGGPGDMFTSASQLGTIQLSAATLNVQTLLIILGFGIGLAMLASVIPAWYVAHIKPALVLRKAN